MGARLLVLAAAVVFVCAVPAASEWSYDPAENNPVSVWAGTEKDECITVPDGSGGAFVIWTEDWVIEQDIYAQRLDADGNPLWGANGIAVCDSAGVQNDACAVYDGNGGVYLAWVDYRRGSADIFAQRLDGNGNPLWAEDGRAISTASNTQLDPGIARVETGGAIIGWRDSRSGTPRIYAQRVAGGGLLVWPPVGVAASGDVGLYGSGPEVVSDGSGGVFLVWHWYSILSGGLRAQHVDSDGIILWGPGGYEISSSSGSDPSVVKDNDDGFFVSYWADVPLVGNDIYVTRIVGDSLAIWSRSMTGLWGGSQGDAEMVSDGAGGVIVAWQQGVADSVDLRAQRLDAGGNKLWTPSGVPFCTYSADSKAQKLVPDGSGGAIVAWEDERGYYRDIYAQRLDPSGEAEWAVDGVLVAGAAQNQRYLSIAPVDGGAAVVAWSDYRNGNADIYAQRIERNGFLGNPAPAITDAADAPGDQGGEIVLGWTASYLDVWPEDVVKRYSVWRRLADPVRGGVSSMPSHDELRSEGVYALERYGWTFVENVLARYLDEYGYVVPSFGDSTESGIVWTELMVLAEATALNDYWGSAVVSSYSVDNVAPGAPLALEALELQSDVGLEWSPSGEFDEDLAHYNIYRSDVSGFEVGEATLVDATADTFYTDVDPGRSLWYYRVAAEDVHSNVGPASNEAWVETWTGTEGVVPTAYSLGGSFPNPFNPVTTVAYGVPEPGGNVTLEVFDVRGRRVRTLVDGLETPGKKVSVWNGTDEMGAPLPSGVYFCKMMAGNYEKTIKLTLLK